MKTIASAGPMQVEDALQTGTALVDFGAPWCAPCRLQEPIVERLARAFKGRAAVRIVNVDKSKDLAEQLEITSIPTLILFQDGRELKRFIGLQSMEALSKAMGEALSKSKEPVSKGGVL
jgi:thioredoxin 1